MKTILKTTTWISSILLLTVFFLIFPVFESNAATLSSTYIMLSRMKSNITSTDNLEMYVAFETSGTIPSGSTLTLEFPDGDDTNWCRVTGSDLTVTGVTSTPADSTGDYDIDASLPGSLSASCSQGSGTGSVDTITITGISSELNNATGTYGVKISNGSTAKLGTSSTTGTKTVTLTVTQGSTSETKSFSIYLVSNDQVTVTATVEEPPTVTCSLSTNSVNLGDLYAGGSYVTGTHTVSAYTSDNAAGYYWAVYGQGNSTDTAGLYKSIASSTEDLDTTGSEGFGLNIDIDDENAMAGTGFSHTDNGSGVFGSLGYSQDHAELFLYKNWGAQTSTSTYTVIYGARAGSSAIPGGYTEVVTYVCGGYYGADESDPYPPTQTDTGWVSPSNYDNAADESRNWVDPTEAYTSDNDYSMATLQDSGNTLSISLSYDGGINFTDTKSLLFNDGSANESVEELGGSSDAWGRTWTASEFDNSNLEVRVLDGLDGGDIDYKSFNLSIPESATIDGIVVSLEGYRNPPISMPPTPGATYLDHIQIKVYYEY